MDNWFNLLPILILAAACFFILSTHHWKRVLIGYAVMFISAFSIVSQSWSFTFSLVKLLTALMSVVIFWISLNNHIEQPKFFGRSEWIFRLAGLSLLDIIVLSLVERISVFLNLPLEVGLASLVIIAFSIFQLGTTHQPHRIFLAILSMYFGFELIFSANEASLLVNGLLAFVSLLVALIGSYLIVLESTREEE